MIETTKGSKFDSNLTTTAIAGLVREEIKQAVRAGTLPKAKYSVRSEYYSMGSSITVRIKDVQTEGFRIYNAERLASDRDNQPHCGVPWMCDEARALVSAVEAMLAAYNRVSRSTEPDDYSNSRFHASVEFETTYQNACHTRELAALDAEAPSEQTPVMLEWLDLPAPANELPETGSAEDLRLEALNDSERAEMRADRLASLAGGFAEGDWA